MMHISSMPVMADEFRLPEAILRRRNDRAAAAFDQAD
jgi:hypothetical protein